MDKCEWCIALHETQSYCVGAMGHALDGHCSPVGRLQSALQDELGK